MERVIDTFIHDVREIIAREGTGEQGMRQLAGRMRSLIRDPDVLATHEEFLNLMAAGTGSSGRYTATGRRSQVLHTDDTGLTLVRSRFDPNEATPIHSHSTWGILGVYAGRDRHEAWARRDGGSGPGHAVVEMIEERVLEAGDVVIIPHPPQDIHRQQGHGGDAAHEFVLFGANAMVNPRLVFDTSTATAREIIPGQE